MDTIDEQPQLTVVEEIVSTDLVVTGVVLIMLVSVVTETVGVV